MKILIDILPNVVGRSLRINGKLSLNSWLLIVLIKLCIKIININSDWSISHFIDMGLTKELP